MGGVKNIIEGHINEFLEIKNLLQNLDEKFVRNVLYITLIISGVGLNVIVSFG